MLHRFGEFEFDERIYELRRDGSPVAIEPRSLDLLAYLLHHRGRLVRHDELIREVWRGTTVSRSAIAFAVSNLRAALGKEAAGAYVHTVHGRGYRFAVGATPSHDADDLARETQAADAGRSALPFVGRLRELLALEQALERAAGGRRCLSLLAGEAGMGKTRLAEEHAEQARARATGVLVGRCLEDDAAPDYWPWLQLVRGALEQDAPRDAPLFLRRWAEGASDRGTTATTTSSADPSPTRSAVGKATTCSTARTAPTIWKATAATTSCRAGRATTRSWVAPAPTGPASPTRPESVYGIGGSASTSTYGSDTLTGIEKVEGSESPDVLEPTSPDTIRGRGGDDWIAGDDTKTTIDYSTAPAGVTVNLVDGTATGGDGNDTLSGIKNIVGSRYADSLTGDNQKNTILGGGGDDLLFGKANDDTLDGGLGNDTADGGGGVDGCTAETTIDCE